MEGQRWGGAAEPWGDKNPQDLVTDKGGRCGKEGGRCREAFGLNTWAKEGGPWRRERVGCGVRATGWLWDG